MKKSNNSCKLWYLIFEKLVEYYKKEGFTPTNVYEAYEVSWNVFKTLLYEEKSEVNEK